MKRLSQKMNSKTILIVILMLCTFSGFTQESEYLKKRSYKAYLTNSIQVWKSVESLARKKYNEHDSDLQALFDLTEIQYGLLNACVANQNKEVFNSYLDKAKNNTDTLLKYNPEWAAAHALKAGILSTEMAFYPAKGMILGPKSNSHIEKALRYNSKEPRGWIQKGGSKLHTPKMFGGDKNEAIECYKKAVSLYEQDSVLCKNNWHYINAKAWLGIAYSQQENYEKAMRQYQSALAFEPGFKWVKHALIPGLKEKMNNKNK